jgi:XFP N-terminal domain
VAWRIPGPTRARGVALWIFHAGPELFRAGWFIESLAMQTLVIFVIRTAGNPFKSRPSRPLVLRDRSQGEAGLLKLFRAFSFPGQLGSHCTPELPGSIHEGGELGYRVSQPFGAAVENPDLIVSVVVGDGEAETGSLAASWHSNKVSESDPRRRRPATDRPWRQLDPKLWEITHNPWVVLSDSIPRPWDTCRSGWEKPQHA